MRLLAVHHGGGIGGAPESMLKLLQRLDQNEFARQALFTEHGPILRRAAELDIAASVVPAGGAFFYSAHARLEPRTLARFLRTFPGAVATARGVLAQLRPNVVHLNTSVLLAWAVAARRERVPVVWMVREVLGPNPLLRRWHARFITRHARQVVGISDAVVDCFPQSAQVKRVYNAVDLAEFEPADASAAKQALGIAAEEPVVIAIGSVQQAKGHWLLLDALTYMPPDVRLVLVTGGAGSDYAASTRGRVKRALRIPLDTLEALLHDATARGVRDRIFVTGYRSDIPRVVAAADVLAFPSLLPEGFGRPIIEAMAAERPVVATDVGPSRELLGAGTGVLVPVDAQALAGAVDSLLRDPRRRHAMGRAGRARVEACFTLERQVAEMSAIYRQVAALG